MANPSIEAFATLLQFSLGANLTFATVLSLFDNPLSKEKSAIDRLEQTAAKLDFASLSGEELKAVNEVRSLRIDVTTFSAELERVTYVWFRPAAVICAVLAGYLLWQTIYFGTFSASIMYQFAAWGTIVPMLSFSMYALIYSSCKVFAFEDRRRGVDKKLVVALDRKYEAFVPAE